MLSKKEVEEVIRKKIESDEELGEKVGGSGHLGYISYKLGDFSTKELPEELIEIVYDYTIFVETEFTYEPDNPPYQYPHKKSVVINKDKQVIKEQEIYEELESNKPNFTEEDWLAAQNNIMEYIEKFLARIEWEYGENRAPIKYPPDFYLMETEDFNIDYCCMIEEDLGSDEKLYFKSENPHTLLDQIKSEFKKRYSADPE